MTRIWSLLLICLALGCSQSEANEGNSLRCEAIRPLMDSYLSRHVTTHQLTSELKTHTVEKYLQRTDPSKILLLQAEADALRHTLDGMFDDLQRNQCGVLVSIQRDIVHRYEDLENNVRQVVSDPGFRVDPTTQLILDPEKRGYPKTLEEQKATREKLIQFQISNYESAGTELSEAKEKLIHRYELLTKRAQEQDTHDLEGYFLDSFALALDPHSRYFTADDLEDFEIDMGLSLEGIGVALMSRDGYSTVEKIIPGGATARTDSLELNDKIIAVAQDGGKPVDIIDMALRDVVRMIRGKKGTKVHLTVLRQGETTKRLTVTIVRDTIDLKEQAAHLRFETREIDGRKLKLAVLELPSFYGNGDPDIRSSGKDVSRLLSQVEGEKADGLLLDLSRNGGGLLEEAIKITGFFIYRGGVVAAQDAGRRPHVYRDPDRGIRYKGPMVVLISRMSASASEILTGALKDYRRGLIVGDTHTFGKGSVQNVKELTPGLGALKTTIAMFFRPGGDSTQRSGVRSDIRIPSYFDVEELGEKTYDYALPPKRIAPFLTDSANAMRINDRWKPITPEIVTALNAKAQPRIDANEEFQKIRKALAKRAESEDVVTLGDLLREKEENQDANHDGDDEDPTDEDEDKLTPQADESLNILADLTIAQAEHK